MATQLKDYTLVDDQTGKEYAISGPEDATSEELAGALEQYLGPVAPEPEAVTPAPIATGNATVEQGGPVAPPAIEPKAEDYEVGMDNFMDFSPENRSLPVPVEKQILQMANDPQYSVDDISKVLVDNQFQSAAPEMITQIQEARDKGVPFGSIEYPDPFEGMIDEKALAEEYKAVNTDWFSQTARSMTEAWADPASLTNWFSRRGSDLLGYHEDAIRERYPDISDEELEVLQDEYIARISRLRGKAAQEGVKDDAMIPWLAGQLFAIEPTDLIPFTRAARAGTKIGRVAEKGVEAAAVGAATDVVGQSLAMYDNAQDEFDPLRTLGSAALSGTIGSGGQAVSDLVGSIRTASPDNPPPSVGGGPIPVPAGKKNTKAYRAELDKTLDSVVDRVNTLARGWSNSPTIKVHANFKGVKDIDDDALGVYTTDKDGKPLVMINTEAVLARAKKQDVTPESVVDSVVFHEALGHHGLTQRFGDQLDTILDVFYTRGTEQFRDLVDTWIKKNPNAYKGPTQRVRATEEVLAEWSEKEGLLPKTFTDMLLNKIKNFARDMGMDLRISEREVRAYLAVAQRRVTEGDPTGATPGVAKNIIEESGKSRDRIRLTRKFPNEEGGNVVGSEEQAAKTFLRELGVFNSGELLRMEQKEAIQKAERLGIDEEWLSYYNDAYLRAYGYDAPNTPQPEMSRYLPDVKFMRGDERTPDTTSAGFKQPKADDRSRAAARKQLWKNKENPDWNPDDPNGLPSRAEELPPVEEGKVRLWRGNRPGEVGQNPQFTNSLDGIARPFMEAYGGPLSYVDVPANVAEEALNKTGAAAPGAEFILPREWASKAKIVEAGKSNAARPQPTPTEGAPDGWGSTANVASKYMRGDGPIDPDNLSADDLIEAKNALELLNRLEYTPTVINPDQLEAEALARNLPPSDITRLVGMEPGKLMKKLFLYDVAATKLSDRAAKIKGDIEENGLTPEKQLAYFETTQTLSDLSQRIFDFQAEIGRTLAATRRVNYSRKRVRDLQAVLKEYGAEALMDPETFYRYMAEMEGKMKANKTKGTPTFKDNVISYVNIPRAIMSSADLSAPLRQGVVFIGNKEYWGSFLKMFSMLGKSGETNYNFLMKKIATHPNYELMQKARLAFSSLDGELSLREEDFQTELARKIPVYGKIVKASEQAYAGFLNKLRADMFNKFVGEYQKAGIELDDEMLKGLGKFINAGTGRAELPEFLRPSSTIINATFFSGRLMYSRVQMLNPAFYANLPKPVRKNALKSMGSFGTVALLVNGALNALWPDEVETELDPRASDFLKVKVGDTRFDIGGGFNQYLILGARTVTWLYNNALGFGERVLDDYAGIDNSLTDAKVANKKTAAGNFRTYGNDEFNQDTYAGALADFFRSKLSPQASYVVDAMVGTDFIGREFTVEGSLASRLIPMTVSGVYEAYAEDSPVPLPVVFTSSLFGVGVNTYKTAGTDPKEELKAPVSFEMSDLEDGENEFVRAEEGVVTLKKQTRDKWEATINTYYPIFVEQFTAEMGYKAFDEMSDTEKKAVIEKAKKEAKANAKADMMYELGLAE
jgi:hypothetical protein